MKKKIVGIFVFILMVIPVISTIAYADPGPEFEINYNSIYFGKIWFDIKNIGDIDAINVDWIIDIDTVIDIPSIPPPWNGAIDILFVSETERISTYTQIFGFGIHNIIIKLKAHSIEEVTFTGMGIFLGPIFIIPKPLSQ